MSPESVIRLWVEPERFAARVGAELEERLKGRINASVRAERGGVVVVTAVASETAADQVQAEVHDAVHGVRQSLALDALDQDLRQVRIKADGEPRRR